MCVATGEFRHHYRPVSRVIVKYLGQPVAVAMRTFRPRHLRPQSNLVGTVRQRSCSISETYAALSSSSSTLSQFSSIQHTFRISVLVENSPFPRILSVVVCYSNHRTASSNSTYWAGLILLNGFFCFGFYFFLVFLHAIDIIAAFYSPSPSEDKNLYGGIQFVLVRGE